MLQNLMRFRQVSPNQTLYVGDRESDRQAAEKAGCAFAWAREFFKPVPEEISKPDPHASILHAAPGVMDTVMPIDWPITKRPECYTDLVSAAQDNLKTRFYELWERAENAYRALIALDGIKDLETARDISREQFMEILSDVIDYGDDGALEWLERLEFDWEGCKSLPGEGYW
jgi:hypothetical protein